MRVGARHSRIELGARSDRLGRPDVAMVDVDERTAGQIAVDDHFEDVVVQAGSGEVPVVVESFVEEIQPVEPFHPADPDLHVEVLRVVIHPVALLGVHELVHADGVALGHHRPIVRLAVDARNLIRRELKDLERHVLALERERRRHEQKAMRAARTERRDTPPVHRYLRRHGVLKRDSHVRVVGIPFAGALEHHNPDQPFHRIGPTLCAVSAAMPERPGRQHRVRFHRRGILDDGEAKSPRHARPRSEISGLLSDHLG